MLMASTMPKKHKESYTRSQAVYGILVETLEPYHQAYTSEHFYTYFKNNSYFINGIVIIISHL